jgi:hypothetical protein
MRRTRRSGQTAGEALPLQFHIVGSQKGAGPLNRRRAPSLAPRQPQAVHAMSDAVALTTQP